MASKSPKIVLFSVVLLFLTSKVHSASIFERSYEYVMSLGKNLAPSFMTILDCLGEDEIWVCAKEKAGKMIDNWEADVEKQRRMWQDAADAEVTSSGRSIEELPSKLGLEVEQSLFSVADLVQHGMARALARKHHEGGGIDSITISTSDKKKKMKKKKPPKIHLVHPMMMAKDEDSGSQSWVGRNANGTLDTHETVMEKDMNDSVMDSSVIGNKNSVMGSKYSVLGNKDSVLDNTDSVLGNKDSIQNTDIESKADDEDEDSIDFGVDAREGRGMFSDLWSVGVKAVDAVAEHAIERENEENEISDKSSFEETRGKKKKKKKAILKLLILGAVLKAKIGTLLQILSFKLQVKFFLIALIGLGINLARFWLDLKKQHAPPQKVIYYEHAQHQHHYDHEHEEDHGWGPWSRSMDNEETDGEVDASALPYRGQVVRNPQILSRPALS